MSHSSLKLVVSSANGNSSCEISSLGRIAVRRLVAGSTRTEFSDGQTSLYSRDQLAQNMRRKVGNFTDRSKALSPVASVAATVTRTIARVAMRSIKAQAVKYFDPTGSLGLTVPQMILGRADEVIE